MGSRFAVSAACEALSAARMRAASLRIHAAGGVRVPGRNSSRQRAAFKPGGASPANRGPKFYRVRAHNSIERPIAPGNGWCPLPPWDPAFPGAFFSRLGRYLLRQSTLKRKLVRIPPFRGSQRPNSHEFADRSAKELLCECLRRRRPRVRHPAGAPAARRQDRSRPEHSSPWTRSVRGIGYKWSSAAEPQCGSSRFSVLAEGTLQA